MPCAGPSWLWVGPCCLPSGRSPFPGAVTCLMGLLPPSAFLMLGGVVAPSPHVNVTHPVLDAWCFGVQRVVATLASSSGGRRRLGGGAVHARPASSPPSSCYAGVTSAASSPWRLLERLPGRFCHSRLPAHLFARQSRLFDTPSQYSGTVTFTTIPGFYSHSSHCHPLPPFGSPPAALHSASSPLSLFTLLTPSLPNWVFHPLPHTFFPRY